MNKKIAAAAIIGLVAFFCSISFVFAGFDYVGGSAVTCRSWKYGSTNKDDAKYWQFVPIGAAKRFEAGEKIFFLTVRENVDKSFRYQMELYRDDELLWTYTGKEFTEVKGSWRYVSCPWELTGDCVVPGNYKAVFYVDEGAGFKVLDSEVFRTLPKATYYLPHFPADPVRWKAYLEVDNRNEFYENQFSVIGYKSGSLVFQDDYTVSADATLVIDLTSEIINVGIVDALGAEMSFRLLYISNTGGEAEFLLQEKLLNEATILFNSTSPSVFWKGFAVANFGDIDEDVIIEAIGANGELLDITTDVIESFSRLVGLSSHWFPGLTAKEIAKIRVTANNSVLQAVSISGDSKNVKMFCFPAQ